MKMIIAIIRPEKLENVEDALRAVLDEGDNFRLTVDTVQGHGRQEGQVELFRGQEVKPRMVTKTRLTICVNDGYVEKSIAAILKGLEPTAPARWETGRSSSCPSRSRCASALGSAAPRRSDAA